MDKSLMPEQKGWQAYVLMTWQQAVYGAL